MSLDGEPVDAEKLAELTLSSAGFRVGMNMDANAITAIGVSCLDIEFHLNKARYRFVKTMNDVHQ